MPLLTDEGWRKTCVGAEEYSNNNYSFYIVFPRGDDGYLLVESLLPSEKMDQYLTVKVDYQQTTPNKKKSLQLFSPTDN